MIGCVQLLWKSLYRIDTVNRGRKTLLNPWNFSAMPKHTRGSSKVKDSKQEGENDFPATVDESKNIFLNILAKPGAKQNKITDITPEGIGIQINAPPTEGEANTELVKYLSSVLGVRKGDISLHRGFKSRKKTIKVEGNLVLEHVKEKIKKEIGN